MNSSALFGLFFVLFAATSAEVFYSKLHLSGEGICTQLADETLRKYKGLTDPSETAVLVKTRPAIVPPPGEPRLPSNENSYIVETYARSRNVLDAHVQKLCKSIEPIEPLRFQDPPEIVQLIASGNQSNRIDVVFMGDGYKATEKAQFFSDIERLVQDMFQGATFRSFLPLFNIWAIYVPSQVSGIGYNGPLNTPFRLYRDQGTLRGIYPGNAAYARQVCAMTGPSGCDYPSLIGNDDFYGGLGGEFVISTKSERTGTVVLRHEMGHNFADVGEEYDGGSVYSGVNAGRNLNSLPWAHWLSAEPREERAAYRLLEYLWEDLAQTNVTMSFDSDGTYSQWFMTISVTAAGDPDSLEFLLDGVPLAWESSGSDDRQFYEWYGDSGFTEGRHTLVIRSRTTPNHPTIKRMVASVDLHEFGREGEEFVIDNNWVSAYPTWDYMGRKTYRPTNAGCLMRNMTHDSLCSICKEGIWYQFLTRISLIDGITKQELIPGIYNVTLSTLKLGQLRSPDNSVEEERLEVRWIKDGNEYPLFDDLFEVPAAYGQWSVTVRLITPEVLSDPRGLLVETENFTIP